VQLIFSAYSQFMKIIDILKNSDLFGELSESQLEKISKIAEIRNCEKDKIIFDEGSEGNEIFILASGRVAIELKLYDEMTAEKIFQTKDNEVFGELCLVGGHRRSARTRALDDVEMLSIARNKLIELMDADPAIGYKIMTNLAKIAASKLRDTNLALRNILMQQKFLFGEIH